MDLSLSLPELLLALSIVASGALVQGTIGFGLAVVAAPFLYQIHPALVPGPIIMAALGIGILSAYRYRQHIDLSTMKYAFLGRIPGSIMGGWLLLLFSSKQMGLFLGASVLIAVAASLSSVSLKANPKSLFVAGLFSGVMGTASSIGGPPIALVMQNESGDRIRANLSVFFVFGGLVSLLVMAMGGMLDSAVMVYGILFIPAVLVGSLAARQIVQYVNQAMIRKALLFLCSVSGVVAISSAITK